MPKLSELPAGSVAVITGGADGIGLAAAKHFLAQGWRVCIADINEEQLEQAQDELGDVMAVATDVADAERMEALKVQVYQELGQVDVLMNNAGAGFGTTAWGEAGNWRKTLEVNLFGVINGLQSFVPAMLAQGTPGLVVNTGSKQGITNPPGDPAYNTSKAAIRALTEQLQHSFRSTEDCRLSAHLLVPGFTYTGIIRKWVAEKPEGAWLPEQVVAFMLDALEQEQFYIICPDNDVSREMDNRRMAWTMGDLIEDRSALSRWDPAYEAAFAAFMEE